MKKKSEHHRGPDNVIEASWHALVDSVQYKLSRDKININNRTARRRRKDS